MGRVTVTARLAFSLVVAFVLVAGSAGPAHAADRDPALRLAIDSTYTLDPDDAAVHVTLDVHATNLKPNRVTSTVITHYYYYELYFAIHEEAARVRATQDGRSLTVRTKREDGYRLLTVRLARHLNYKQTAHVRISFDLASGKPRSDSAIRVGRAFATFYAWAWGDPGRSTVRIVVPALYETEVSGKSLHRSAEGRSTIYTSGSIGEPGEWYAGIEANRPSELRRELVSVPGSGSLSVRSWPEDAAWHERVRDLLRDGIPELRELIGFDWRVGSSLVVSEVHTPALEGYGGVFRQGQIQIGEDLDDLTIVHEAAHAWFDPDLWSQRWIYEGFADAYAGYALEELGRDGGEPTRPDPTAAGGIPLNQWRHPGRIADERTDRTERYGYSAARWVIDTLVDEIGVDGMRKVLAAARARTTPYPGEDASERDGEVPSWRRFLDLLEEVGGSTRAEAVFRDLVADATDEKALDARAEARARYAALVEAAHDWHAPTVVRSRLADWEFEKLGPVMEEAEALLAIRDRLHADALALGLEPPDSFESAWEQATTDFTEARAVSTRQAESLDVVEAAGAALDRPADLVAAVGLLGAPSPEQDLVDARAAWEADRTDEAIAEANTARATIDAAPEAGRARLTVGGAVIALVVALLAAVGWRRRRGRRLVAPVVGTGTYATLAANPDNLPDPAVAALPGADAADPPPTERTEPS